MKLRDIKSGNRAIKRVPLPLVNRPSIYASSVSELERQLEAEAKAAAEAGETPTPDQVLVGLRVLTLDELSRVYEKAGEFARERGSTSPNNTDPIYNLGVSIYICALACVDPDSSPADPEPFFGTRGDLESAARELLCSPHIGRDGIAYLAEAHEAWQDACNPQANRVSPHTLYELVTALADSNTERALDPFLALRPGMRFSLARTMAGLLVSSPELKYLFGATPAETQSNGSSAQSAGSA